MDLDQRIANKIYKELPNIFEEVYLQAGIKEEYFYLKQVHALRHVGAHYWLNRTNDIMTLKCKECGLVFYSMEGLEVHILRKHTKPIPRGLDYFTYFVL